VEFVSQVIVYGGILLQVLLVLLLLKGHVRSYFPLLLYVSVYAVSTILEYWVVRQVGTSGPRYFSFYWRTELLLDFLLFFLVIAVTVRALEDNPIQPKITRFLAMVLVVVLLLPLVLFGDPAPQKTSWNRSVSQLWNFGAAVMNLGLWMALIISKRRDPRILRVAAGLGIAVAGAAFTLGVQRFTNEDSAMREIGDFAHRVMQVGGLMIWCWAFWPIKARPRTPEATPISSAA
jgi:hypothetical protein